MKHFSERSAHLRQSDIRAVTALVNKHNGINLGQGICDLPTPDVIQRGAIEAISASRSVYSPYAGIAEVRELLMTKFKLHNNINIESVSQVMATSGSTGGFVAATFALLNPGDEVLLFEPFYGYHNNLLVLAGAVLKPVAMNLPTWEIPWDELERQVSARTKMVVVNTPNNPCGKVWTKAELEQLVAFATRHDLWIVTDEVYEYMVYDGRKHISLASLPGAFERTVTLTSFSKTFNMTGWRLGAACGPAPVMERMGLIADLVYICAPTPLQYGLLEGLKVGESYYEDLKRSYEKKRDYFCTALETCGFSLAKPEGAYYAFASFEKIANKMEVFGNGTDAVRSMIVHAGVAAVPGASFFSDPENGRYYLRFCFAKEWEVLREACNKMIGYFTKNIT